MFLRRLDHAGVPASTVAGRRDCACNPRCDYVLQSPYTRASRHRSRNHRGHGVAARAGRFACAYWLGSACSSKAKRHGRGPGCPCYVRCCNCYVRRCNWQCPDGRLVCVLEARAFLNLCLYWHAVSINRAPPPRRCARWLLLLLPMCP